MDIDNMRVRLDEEQQALQEAQQKQEIPSFPIAPLDSNLIKNTISSLSIDVINSYHYTIRSQYDDAMKITTFIDKDSCIIEQQTDPSTWKYSNPDLDALASLYARVIGANNQQGKRLINIFKQWSIYDLFTAHVFRHITWQLEQETYEDQNLLAENLVSLAQKILQTIDFNDTKVSSFQEKKFLSLLLCLSASKSYDSSGNILNTEWKTWHDTFLTSLCKHPTVKNF